LHIPARTTNNLRRAGRFAVFHKKSRQVNDLLIIKWLHILWKVCNFRNFAGEMRGVGEKETPENGMKQMKQH